MTTTIQHYKGQEVEVESRTIDDALFQERFFFTHRNGSRMARHIIKVVNHTGSLMRVTNKGAISALVNFVGIRRRFLTCISSDMMAKLTIYEFGEKNRRDLQEKKILQIYEWAKTNPNFNQTFLSKAMKHLDEYNELTEKQENSLDKIIRTFNVPTLPEGEDE